MQMQLITPLRSHYAASFEEKVAILAPLKKWTLLLGFFAQYGVDLPAACTCDRYSDTWVHEHHGRHNRDMRAIIMAFPGARAALHKALSRELGSPLNPEDPRFGYRILRTYALDLEDFLREKPAMDWFWVPSPSALEPKGPLYQGHALDDQKVVRR